MVISRWLPRRPTDGSTGRILRSTRLFYRLEKSCSNLEEEEEEKEEEEEEEKKKGTDLVPGFRAGSDAG